MKKVCLCQQLMTSNSYFRWSIISSVLWSFLQFLSKEESWCRHFVFRLSRYTFVIFIIGLLWNKNFNGWKYKSGSKKEPDFYISQISFHLEDVCFDCSNGAFYVDSTVITTWRGRKALKEFDCNDTQGKIVGTPCMLCAVFTCSPKFAGSTYTECV
jgi:hypothetical protein